MIDGWMGSKERKEKKLKYIEVRGLGLGVGLSFVDRQAGRQVGWSSASF